VREHGVAGDDLAFDRQHPQELQRGFVLVGLGIDPELGHNRFDVRGLSGHQVDGGRATIATAPGGLAVERQVRGVAWAEPPSDPLTHPRLEVGDVDPAKDPRVGGLAEAAPPGEPQELEEGPIPLLAVLDDGLVTGHARERGDDGQREEGGEGVPLAPGTARIMDTFKEFHQGGIGFHA
jgi:hypothetical protein